MRNPNMIAKPPCKNHLLTPESASQIIYYMYPNHANSLRESGLEPSVSVKWQVYVIICMRKKWLVTREMTRKNLKIRHVYFCIVYSCHFSISKSKKTLSWLRVQIFYHRLNNVAGPLNGYPVVKIGL